ncbi:hypothetical protein HMPREF0201_00991 [Cedecea davisae DSM 4568]|uniref:Uncharacterized protein n=1 Tax=Cedecea davisae DSM 4568 TaxID=566551 RepID=S3JDX2_9ENTR|nr:hypothetical protein HMPREF0201_00991 [Cedecea davisae DSM 4568]
MLFRSYYFLKAEFLDECASFASSVYFDTGNMISVTSGYL